MAQINRQEDKDIAVLSILRLVMGVIDIFIGDAPVVLRDKTDLVYNGSKVVLVVSTPVEGMLCPRDYAPVRDLALYLRPIIRSPGMSGIRPACVALGNILSEHVSFAWERDRVIHAIRNLEDTMSMSYRDEAMRSRAAMVALGQSVGTPLHYQVRCMHRPPTCDAHSYWDLCAIAGDYRGASSVAIKAFFGAYAPEGMDPRATTSVAPDT